MQNRVTKALDVNSQLLCTPCSLNSKGKENSKQPLIKEELESNTCRYKSMLRRTSSAAKKGHSFNN